MLEHLAKNLIIKKDSKVIRQSLLYQLFKQIRLK